MTKPRKIRTRYTSARARRLAKNALVILGLNGAVALFLAAALTATGGDLDSPFLKALLAGVGALAALSLACSMTANRVERSALYAEAYRRAAVLAARRPAPPVVPQPAAEPVFSPAVTAAPVPVVYVPRPAPVVVPVASAVEPDRVPELTTQ